VLCELLAGEHAVAGIVANLREPWCASGGRAAAKYSSTPGRTRANGPAACHRGIDRGSPLKGHRCKKAAVRKKELSSTCSSLKFCRPTVGNSRLFVRTHEAFPKHTILPMREVKKRTTNLLCAENPRGGQNDMFEGLTLAENRMAAALAKYGHSTPQLCRLAMASSNAARSSLGDCLLILQAQSGKRGKSTSDESCHGSSFWGKGNYTCCIVCSVLVSFLCKFP